MESGISRSERAESVEASSSRPVLRSQPGVSRESLSLDTIHLNEDHVPALYRDSSCSQWDKLSQELQDMILDIRNLKEATDLLTTTRTQIQNSRNSDYLCDYMNNFIRESKDYPSLKNTRDAAKQVMNKLGRDTWAEKNPQNMSNNGISRYTSYEKRCLDALDNAP